MNPFAILNLPTQFELDDHQIEHNYRTLLIRFHPDKVAAASAFEKKQAMMMSAAINQAYELLKNPLNRAAYLLEQKGINVDSHTHTQFPAEFLMQQMQWREQLNEAKITQNNTELNLLLQEITQQQQNLYQELQTALHSSDDQQAAQLIRQGRFLDKMKQEINAA